ncbi:MAG: translational GTPase TypA [Hyphomicrobiales bacterium]|nr:MAG: translational GTPase TypA [Hyphomicrobiales bacterium]
MQMRNVAIIAHVDHGKTTLVDQLLRQSGLFRDNQQLTDRAMDREDLERERGITILAKCTSVMWHSQEAGDVRINVVDTPGHADFGGEVERILSMVDGVVLLVDAAEGPMPQTKFVTMKALALGLPAIVVINKADRPDARLKEVHEEVFDLFADLNASEVQLDFPLIIASAKEGWAREEHTPKGEETHEGPAMTPLYETIIDHVPAPAGIGGEAEKLPFSLRATLIESDPYLGRLLTGRVETGRVRPNMPIKALNLDGKKIEDGRIAKVLAFRGLARVPVEEAGVGDLVAIAGLSEATVADTLCAPEVEVPLDAPPIDPPTLAVTFSINNSPLAGRDGDKVQSRVIRDRLLREAESNVAIRVSETDNKDAYEVAGRGELQLGVLIETMRREGFELSVSRPRVLYQTDEAGKKLEPVEEVIVDVDEEYSGVVIEKLSGRKGELKDMRPQDGGKVRLTLHVPSRGLIGYHGEFMTDTRGAGVINRVFHGYTPWRGPIAGRRTGVLVSNGQGEAVAFALWNLEDRGVIFIKPGDKVYEGMVIGENAKSDDIIVNPLKAKQLTNIRASGKDEAIRLTPPRPMSLEQAIAYIDDDELVEVTPNHLRIRKQHLDPHARKRAARAASD